MNTREIICPHCQKAFKIDEAGYANILNFGAFRSRMVELGQRGRPNKGAVHESASSPCLY